MEWLTEYFVKQGLGFALAVVVFGVLVFREKVNRDALVEKDKIISQKDSEIRALETKRVEDVKNIHDVVLTRVEKIQDNYIVTMDRLKEISNSILTMVQTIQSVVIKKE